MHSKKNPPVSVLMINYKDKKHTIECLERLKKQTYRGNFEVLLLDNDSQDGSHEFLAREIKKQKWPVRMKVKLHSSSANIGLSGGIEHLKKFAKHNLIAFIDNDAVPHDNWLKGMVDVIIQHPNTPLVGCIINNVGDFYEKRAIKNDFVNLIGEPVEVKTNDPYATFKIPEGGFLFRRDIIPNLYDPIYFMYGGDIYASWLARIKGYDIKMAPDSVYDHIGGLLRKKNPMLEFHGEKNKVMNWILVYEKSTLIKLIPVFMLDIFAVLVFSTLRGRGHMRLKSYWWVIKNINLILKKRKWFQNQRKVPDKEILPLISSKFAYNYPILTPITNFILKWYCHIANLPVIETKK